MTLRRLILEMGTGNDLYGQDFTKAAIRAVQDALHHSSLTLFRSLDLDPNQMRVVVHIGVSEPDLLRIADIKAQIPYGSVDVQAVEGGLRVEDEANGIVSIVATAAIEAYYPIEDGRFSLVE